MNLLQLILFLLTFTLPTCIHLSQLNSQLQWVAEGKHDNTCFVQGISFLNDTHILESCGMYGQSYFHILEYNREQTSLRQTYRSQLFSPKIFLQGSILFPKNNVIYFLTYREGIVYRFNSTTYQQIQPNLQWHNGEGWSLTHNVTHMFVNNGSNLIFVVDQNFNILETKSILKENGQKQMSINEMQWVREKGENYIYANVWPSNYLIKINLKTNTVQKTFNEWKMTEQNQKAYINKYPDVLNGIAYDQINDTFLMTGKYWELFFKTKLDH